mmetsp:Transcript_82414/g.229627  ORF Transcript_82414/g.229627 Transcript_82414/m.229627 type:complete len:528 (+) Transcript_82414:76-1659(+)
MTGMKSTFQDFADELAKHLEGLHSEDGEGCAEYMKNKALPVLKQLASAFSKRQPKDPEAFAAHWFAGGSAEAVVPTGSTAEAGFKIPFGRFPRGLARNPIRSLATKLLKSPGCIPMAGGRPLESLFPQICGEPPDNELMNYGPNLAVGAPKLRAWAKDFVEKHHAPPCGWDTLDVIMMPGATNSIAMTVLLCTDVDDSILCDEFTYTGLVAVMNPLGRRAVGVKMDESGMIPAQLREVVAGLAAKHRAPRLLYMVPTGQNPTGLTMPEGRRREILEVARELQLMIIEDDPYYHLALGPEDATDAEGMPGMESKTAVPPSFLALDTDGRVCRLDSGSKTFAPGFRLSWLTAPRAMTGHLAVMGEVLTWSLSGFAQQALMRCVEDLGAEGLHKHMQRLQWVYRQKRDLCVEAFGKHLHGLATWKLPTDGMFLWVEVLGLHDACRLAEPLVDRGVAMVPGSAFLAEPYSTPCSKFRVSFTQLTKDSADEAGRRLAEALRDDQWLAMHGVRRGHDCEEAVGEAPEKVPRVC